MMEKPFLRNVTTASAGSCMAPEELMDPPEDIPRLQIEHVLCTQGSLDHVAPCRKGFRGQITSFIHANPPRVVLAAVTGSSMSCEFA